MYTIIFYWLSIENWRLCDYASRPGGGGSGSDYYLWASQCTLLVAEWLLKGGIFVLYIEASSLYPNAYLLRAPAAYCTFNGHVFLDFSIENAEITENCPRKMTISCWKTAICCEIGSAESLKEAAATGVLGSRSSFFKERSSFLSRGDHRLTDDEMTRWRDDEMMRWWDDEMMRWWDDQMMRW